MESRWLSARDCSRGPKAKTPPEQLPGRTKKPAAKKITKNMKDNSPLLMDATGDNGDKHNAGSHDGGIRGNNGDDGLDATCYGGDKFNAI